MSKFNKIYEYECHLFGQVSEYAHMYLCVCSLVFSLCLTLMLYLRPAPECDDNNDISVGPFTGSGV